MAFGNGDDGGTEEVQLKAQTGKTWMSSGELDVDCDKILADIQGRIQEG